MNKITVQTLVRAPIEKVWEFWTTPEYITQWCYASDDWEAPRAENDLRVGGTFNTVMAAKDGSSKFDFSGTYTLVIPHERIEYMMDDGRQVQVTFSPSLVGVEVIETFDAEQDNSEEVQRAGWQAILDNFKKQVEL